MMFAKRLVIALSVLLSAAFIALECLAADVVSSSSTLPHRRRVVEGTFVRGMMAADHQFGLYMAVRETSRGGGSDHDENDGMTTAVVSRDGIIGPFMHMHHVALQARDAAVNLASGVRQRAFPPPVEFRPKAR